MGDDYLTVCRVSVDYSGSGTAAIYEDFGFGVDGPGPGPGDPGDTNTPAWWGDFRSEEAYCGLSIVNFDGQSFYFEISFLRDGSLLYDGVAALQPGNEYMAMYEEINFALAGDFSAIDVFVPEDSEWSHLSGEYVRLD